MNQNNQIDQNIIDQIIGDQSVRKILTKESHRLFFHIYFYEYTKYETADFHQELFEISENENTKLAIVVAFRGCGKSTILTQSYPIWAILGKQQKKCIVILSKTKDLVKTHFSNIKRTLESNELLKQDLGPFQEESDEWGAYSIVIPRFDAKIIAASSEQSIRGIRHGAYRPDLVICDDIEDTGSVKTKEGRDSNFNWFTGEILPIGDRNTKYIVVGNLLHNDSITMRIKEKLNEFPKDTTHYMEVPIIAEDGTFTWPGKYPSEKEMEVQRMMAGDEKTWQREYMLKIVSEDDQIVFHEWIQHYDSLPEKTEDYRYTITAVDLAISEKSSADYTAIITAHVFGHLDDKRVYILPHPTNRRMDFPKTVEEIKNIYAQSYYGRKSTIYIEDVGYQKAIIQQLHKEGIYVKGFQVHGQDKKSRLNTVTPLIKHGQVLFPKDGGKELIQQLVYFGVEKHDDLVDAFSMLLHVVMDEDYAKPVPLDPEIVALLRGGGGSWYGNRGGYYSGGGAWM